MTSSYVWAFQRWRKSTDRRKRADLVSQGRTDRAFFLVFPDTFLDPCVKFHFYMIFVPVVTQFHYTKNEANVFRDLPL